VVEAYSSARSAISGPRPEPALHAEAEVTI